MIKYQLREMTIDDILIVTEQETKIFGSSIGYDMFYQEIKLNDYAYFFVLEVNGQIEGYIGLWIVANSAEVINFYIMPEYRGQGFGEMILKFVLEVCELSGVEQISLEVRQSNLAAKNLYSKYGFGKVSERIKYYPDGEDADVMVKRIEVVQ